MLYSKNEPRVVWGGIKWEKDKNTRVKRREYLEQYNYKVFSQNGEDGIISEIFHRIGTDSKVFVEFGVQNGMECNSHYLLFKGWNGLWIEGDYDYCWEIRLRFEAMIKYERLKVVNQFITAENIDSIIIRYLQGIDRDNVDFLSIDIDGNDYNVWEAIKCIKPRCVCIEYNGKFPPDLEWKQAYNPDHVWDGSDWHGASLKSMELLGKMKGYTLVGTDLNGVNAFFVRNDLVGDRFPYSHRSEDLFNALGSTSFCCGAHKSEYCLVDTLNQHKIGNFISVFPFRRVKKDSRIVLWGAGKNGQGYADQITKLNYCKILYFIDKYVEESKYKGIRIVTPQEADMTFDYIVITVMDKIEAKSIYEELIKEYRISKDKIVWRQL